ncbi:Karyopherin transporter [Ascosphaera pollenicola]|nr:Karyopherin transporter [Ascosphaera pollenicola]
MARLNDVPIASETLESLKRRFVRQNREIARANSIQSLRIRNLESENARLLSENCSLREEITSLNTKLEKFQPNKSIDDSVSDLKCKLEIKLKEMSDLVVGLGQIPKRRSSLSKDTRLLNEAGQAAVEIFHQKRLDRENLSNDLAGLPVIDEDLSYDGLAENPPTEQRDGCSRDTEQSRSPVHLGRHSSSADQQKYDIANVDEITGFDTVEQTESTLQLTSNPATQADAISAGGGFEHIEEIMKTLPEEMPRQVSESPFKSKSEPEVIPNDENDNLKHTHIGKTPDSKHVNKARKAKTSASRKRNALRPKSTNSIIQLSNNTNGGIKVVEPVKNVPPVSLTNLTTDGPGICKSKDSAPSEEENPVLNRRLPSTEADSADHDSMETSGMEPCHTPPPQMSAAASALAMSSRPSRRSRPAVSYAEPNLRAKMRRPTKEFVGAVEGERVLRRISANLADEPLNLQISAGDDALQGRRSLENRKSDEGSINSKRSESGMVPAPLDTRASKKRKTSMASGIETASSTATNYPTSSLPADKPAIEQSSRRRSIDDGNLAAEATSESHPEAAPGPSEEPNMSKATRRHSTALGSKKISRRSIRASGRVMKEKPTMDIPEEQDDISTPDGERLAAAIEPRSSHRIETRRRSMMI